MKNNKNDLELGLILISNEINYVQLELIKHQTYDNVLVQKAIKSLMNSIIISQVDKFIDFTIIDNNDQLLEQLHEIPIYKKKKEIVASNTNLKFALSQLSQSIRDLQFSLIYNKIENVNVQHYIIRLLKYLVKIDLTIYLTINKVALN